MSEFLEFDCIKERAEEMHFMFVAVVGRLLRSGAGFGSECSPKSSVIDKHLHEFFGRRGGIGMT